MSDAVAGLPTEIVVDERKGEYARDKLHPDYEWHETPLVTDPPWIRRYARGKRRTTFWVLVDTDNFAGDYPNEKFILQRSVRGRGLYETTEKIEWAHKWEDEADAKTIANFINHFAGEDSPRFVDVKKDSYQLQPGFEP